MFFLLNMFGAVLIAFALALPQTAYALKTCCPCGVCRADCICGCPCGGFVPGESCLVSKDEADHTATFKEKKENGKNFTLPLSDNGVLANKQIGDCGFVVTEPICVDFDTSGSALSNPNAPMGR